MTLPLVACATIWGIGDASPANVAWLSILHTVIGAAAMAWTGFRLALSRRSAHVPRTVPRRLPSAGLLVLYALLVLQPVLAVAGGMLHGTEVTLFGMALPSILPINHPVAVRIDELHGWNALLLLGLIAMQIAGAFRAVHRQTVSI